MIAKFSVLSTDNMDSLDRLTAILMLSILLLTLYETFFEARARYLYAYLPI